MALENNSLDNGYAGSAYDSSLEAPLLPAEPTVALEGAPRRHSLSFKHRKTLFIVNGLVLVLIAIVGVASFLMGNVGKATGPSTSQKATNYANASLPVDKVKANAQLQVGEADHLKINGQVNVGNTLVLSPTATPASPITGQIYYNQATNQPYYYNGKQFVSFAQSSGQSTLQQSVTSIGGSSGAIGLGSGLRVAGGQLGLQLQAGNGVSVNGSTISNTGVVSLAPGTSNIVIDQDGNGHYTISDVTIGLISGTGTAGQIPLFTTGQSLGDSVLSQSGGTVTDGGALVIQGAASAASLSVAGAASANSLSVTNGITAGTLAVSGAASAGSLTVSGASTLTGLLTAGAGIGLTGDFNQAGAGNFTSGSGAVSLQGNTTVGGTLAVTSGATSLGGTLAVTGAITANTLQSTSNHQLDIRASGSGILSFVSNGITFNLPSNGNLTQTICTANSTCATGGQAAVLLGPETGNVSSFQSDNSANSIWIYNNNAGNLLRLEGGVTETTAFLVDNAGNVTQAGTLALGTSGPSGGLNGAITFKNSTNNASFTLQSGATTGNLVFTLPTSDGISGNCIKTNGSGVLSFSTCASGSGVTVVGTIDSQSPKSADGAKISGTSIYLQSADANFPGLVSTGTQTLAGDKTFSGAVTIQGAGTGLNVTNNVSIGGTSTLTGLLTTNGGITDAGNFLQTGAGTFTTGSGAVSLQGPTSVSGSNNFTVGTGATSLGGTLAVTGTSTLTGQLNANGGIVTNNANINAGSGTITSGTINGQTISSVANFTGTVAIQGANALTLGTASTSTGAIVFKGSGGTGTLTLQGPTTPNAGNFTLSLPAITGSDTLCTLTTCAAGGSNSYIKNQATVQTTANYYIRSAATNSVTGVLEGANGQTADLLDLNTFDGTTSSTVAKFSNIGALTAVGLNSGSGLIQGSGGATISGTSALGTLTTSAGATIGNGLAVTTGATSLGGTLAVAGSATVTAGLTVGSASQTGTLKFAGTTGFTVSLLAPTIPPSANIVLTLPSDAGFNGFCLKTDGSGLLSFQNCIAGTGGGGGLAAIANDDPASGAPGVQHAAAFNIQGSANTVGNILQEGPSFGGTATDLLEFKDNTTNCSGVACVQSAFGPDGKQLRIDGATAYAGALTIGTSAATTSADGVSFGGDTSLYRSASGALSLQGVGNGVVRLQAASVTGNFTSGTTLNVSAGGAVGSNSGGSLNLQVATPPASSFTESFINSGGMRPVVTDSSFIYWVYKSTTFGGAVGRANLSDGSQVDTAYVSGSSVAQAQTIANDGINLYFTSINGSSCNAAIGYAVLNNTTGSNVTASSVTKLYINPGSHMCNTKNVTYYNGYLYWTNTNGDASNGGQYCIGRAQVYSGSTFLTTPIVTTNFLCSTSTTWMNAPLAIAVNNAGIFWSNTGSTISRANLDGSGTPTTIISATGGVSSGISFDTTSSQMYWTNSSSTLQSVATASYTFSAPSTFAITPATTNTTFVNEGSIGSGGDGYNGGPWGVAATPTAIYWANSTNTTIGIKRIGGAANPPVTVASLSGINGAASFQNSVNSSNGFLVQNASVNGNASLLNVDTSTTSNLLGNGDFEAGDGANGWNAKGSGPATLNTDSSQAWQGNTSLNIASTTSAGDGASYAVSLTSGQTYTLSFYALTSSGSNVTDLGAGYQVNGSTDTNCTLSSNTVTASWARYICTFTVVGTPSASDIYVDKTGGGASDTFNIDGIQLQKGSNVTPFNPGGLLQLNAVVGSPLALQNKSDSTTAFQIQNAVGTANIFDVDTINSRVGIGTIAPGAKLDIQATTNIALNINQTGSNDLLDLQSNGSTKVQVTSTGTATFSAAGTALTVTTTASIATLNVTTAATIGISLTVNGHIITGNSSGTTTGIGLVGDCSVAGANPTITGNDTAGLISYTTANSGTCTAAPGTLVQVNFGSNYAAGATPYVVVTGATPNAPTLQIYVDPANVNNTSFKISVNANASPNTTYKFYYHVFQ